jgi:hypothetical protein
MLLPPFLFLPSLSCLMFCDWDTLKWINFLLKKADLSGNHVDLLVLCMFRSKQEWATPESAVSQWGSSNALSAMGWHW